VPKHFDFTKAQLKDYGVSNDDIDTIFAGTTGFVNKYSKKPRKSLTSAEIRETADADAKALQEKIVKRLAPLGLTTRRIQKVVYELPDGEELMQLLLSYRIHGTEERTRVRIPLNSSIREHDIVAKQFKKINNDNVSNE
jgi:type IV pilus biogenesis protein CpaD/CtpE